MVELKRKQFALSCFLLLFPYNLLAAHLMTAPVVRTEVKSGVERESIFVTKAPGSEMCLPEWVTSGDKQGPGLLQAGRKRPVTMNIQGKIVKGENGYFIQGQMPREVFTILNPDPDTLDKYVQSGETVTIEVDIVMGDNVDIRKINKNQYLAPKR